MSEHSVADADCTADLISFHGYEQPLRIYGQKKTTRTGEVVGIEVLLRSLGLDRSAAEIIDYVELNDTVHELTLDILYCVCMQLRLLLDRGVVIPVSVNVAPASLHEHVARDISKIVQEADVPPSLLMLEITERQPIEDAQYVTLHELHMLGVKLALDDFGVGYANMEILDGIRQHGDYVQEVKLDKQYLNDIVLLKNTADELLQKGYTVTVEGVETEEQLAELPESVVVQGFYFSRPKRFSEILAEL